MKREYTLLPCYTGDVSGACSALYELGGMIIIHDPSGCNSTYNTHDETRWYDQDSLIFISGFSETDAILGRDDKLIQEVTDTARVLQPAFIALLGSPIPYINGTDFSAIARLIKKQTGIPAFYIPTNGMHDYIRGAGAALQAAAVQFLQPAPVSSEAAHSAPAASEQAGAVRVPQPHAGSSGAAHFTPAASGQAGAVRVPQPDHQPLRADTGDDNQDNSYGRTIVESSTVSPGPMRPRTLNLLGMTPLDFAAKDSVPVLRQRMEHAGWQVISCWAMDTSLEELRQAWTACVNLVVSAAGLPAARYLYEHFSIPYVTGIPIDPFSEVLFDALSRSLADGQCRMPQRFRGAGTQYYPQDAVRSPVVCIGEPVTMGSLAAAISYKYNCETRLLCPLEADASLLAPTDQKTAGEEDVCRQFQSASAIIADPLYQSAAPAGIPFYSLPHQAFSGRIGWKHMKNLFTLDI